jgi:hypothetical protein
MAVHGASNSAPGPRSCHPYSQITHAQTTGYFDSVFADRTRLMYTPRQRSKKWLADVFLMREACAQLGLRSTVAGLNALAGCTPSFALHPQVKVRLSNAFTVLYCMEVSLHYYQAPYKPLAGVRAGLPVWRA